MADIIKHERFDADQFYRVEPPKRPVMLKSGGPIMECVFNDHEKAICEWDDGRATFPLTSLYRVIEFDKTHDGWE